MTVEPPDKDASASNQVQSDRIRMHQTHKERAFLRKNAQSIKVIESRIVSLFRGKVTSPGTLGLTDIVLRARCPLEDTNIIFRYHLPSSGIPFKERERAFQVVAKHLGDYLAQYPQETALLKTDLDALEIAAVKNYSPEAIAERKQRKLPTRRLVHVEEVPVKAIIPVTPASAETTAIVKASKHHIPYLEKPFSYVFLPEEVVLTQLGFNDKNVKKPHCPERRALRHVIRILLNDTSSMHKLTKINDGLGNNRMNPEDRDLSVPEIRSNEALMGEFIFDRFHFADPRYSVSTDGSKSRALPLRELGETLDNDRFIAHLRASYPDKPSKRARQGFFVDRRAVNTIITASMVRAAMAGKKIVVETPLPDEVPPVATAPVEHVPPAVPTEMPEIVAKVADASPPALPIEILAETVVPTSSVEAAAVAKRGRRPKPLPKDILSPTGKPSRVPITAASRHQAYNPIEQPPGNIVAPVPQDIEDVLSPDTGLPYMLAPKCYAFSPEITVLQDLGYPANNEYLFPNHKHRQALRLAIKKLLADTESTHTLPIGKNIFNKTDPNPKEGFETFNNAQLMGLYEFQVGLHTDLNTSSADDKLPKALRSPRDVIRPREKNIGYWVDRRAVNTVLTRAMVDEQLALVQSDQAEDRAISHVEMVGKRPSPAAEGHMLAIEQKLQLRFNVRRHFANIGEKDASTLSIAMKTGISAPFIAATLSRKLPHRPLIAERLSTDIQERLTAYIDTYHPDRLDAFKADLQALVEATDQLPVIKRRGRWG